MKKVIQTLTGSDSTKSVSSIKELTVSQFLQGYCYDDYTGVKDWEFIMSEFLLAKKDKIAIEYATTVAGIKQIEINAWRVDWLCRLMQIEYVPELAALLREEYPGRKFLPDTYKKDLQVITNIEKNNKVEYDSLRKQLDDLNKRNGGDATNDSRYDNMMSLIFDINKYAGFEAIKMQSSTEHFAFLICKYEEQIEHLKEQNK